MQEKNKNLHRPRRNRLAWLGWAVAALVLLYFFSPWIGKFFLTLGREANESAYYEVLGEVLQNEEGFQLPTYTPLPTHTPFPTPTPIPPAFIIQQMESQAKLVVVKKEISRRNFHLGVDEGLCSHGADFTAFGVIEAGIDFDAIDEDSVAYNARSQSYTLELPAPEFTSCRIESIRLIKNSFSICNPDFDRARALAEVQVMKEFVDESLEDGLLADAQENTELILGDFVRNITGKPVQVTFEKQSRTPKRDSSCRPVASGGWRYNRIKNVWEKSR